MPNGAVENASPAVLPHPRQRVVVVLAEAVATRSSLIDVSFLDVDTEKHADPVPQIRPMDTKELVGVLEALAAERQIERVVGVIEFDEDVFVAVTVVRAAFCPHVAFAWRDINIHS